MRTGARGSRVALVHRLPRWPPGRHGTCPTPVLAGRGRTIPGLSWCESGQSVVEFALVVPLMVIILFAIIDFARIYTTMMSVESAAREAADFGTTLGAGKWQPGGVADATVSEMKKRACVASSNLPDYVDVDADPSNGCANPSFTYCLADTASGTCVPSEPPPAAPAGCEVPTRIDPCTVTVGLSYEFHLIAPFNIEIFGVRYGVPSTITFQRDSTFAMTDIDLSSPTGGS